MKTGKTFVKVADGSGELDFSENYADGNVAVLLNWDGMVQREMLFLFSPSTRILLLQNELKF